MSERPKKKKKMCLQNHWRKSGVFGVLQFYLLESVQFDKEFGFVIW